MTHYEMTDDKTKQALWNIKESAWNLYGQAFWKPGVAQLVKTIEKTVNAEMERLGYDPMVITK